VRKSPQWPGCSGQPRPRIPARAEEKVTKSDASGVKVTSEFWLDGKLVGSVHWNPDGTPLLAVGIRNDALSGYQLEYHEGGGLHAEPFVNGVLHGQAKQ
jgi:antitoxin component YwqK of YwqJK toxin-antitoxin module